MQDLFLYSKLQNQNHDGMINVEIKIEIGYEGSQSVICSIVFFYPSSFSRNF